MDAARAFVLPSASMIRARVTAAGRPSTDPGCAGCPQLGTFRALRRAGLGVQGGLGCDPAAAVPAGAAHAGTASDRRAGATGDRRAVVAGVDEALRRGPRVLLDEAARTGAGPLVIAGPPGARAARLAAALSAAGARVLAIDPARPKEAEELVARAVAGPGAAIVALAPCTRGRAPGAPVEIAAARCNRCGACLSLGCPAIADLGDEAMVVDPSVCTGCGLCAPLCRSGAIGPG